MISTTTAVQNIFKNNYTVQSEIGCTIEYNMNSLINNVSVSYDSSLEPFYYPNSTFRINPYKKIFPIDSIIKPFRPLASGIKYYTLISGDTTSQSFSSFKTLEYPSNQPRIYYPGITNPYKYWVTPNNRNANLTVTYSNGTTKHALTNKIVIRFEKYHRLPSSYSVTIAPKTGSAVSYGPFTPASDGNGTLYYNGSSWSTTAPSEPITYASPQEIKSIQLTAVNSGGIVGVIELSARWIKDLSSDLTSMDIENESSSSDTDVLPVGLITANSTSLNLINYNQTSLKYVAYNRADTSFDSSLTYLVKDAEIKPYIKIIHDNGTITSGSTKYDKIPQGTFYVDTWNIDSFGETSVNALDGSRYLMQSISPQMLCEDYPVTSIIRRLLDSIGFTNYQFNLLKSGSSVIDKSIPLLSYYWSDGTQTVWECIQELCRDIQMNAFFDENNTLKFFSRDYLYSQTTSNWDFYNEASGSRLPDILDFKIQEIPSANQVKIRWQTPTASNYIGSAIPLWQSQTSFLSAGGLRYAISSTATESDLNNSANPGLVIDNSLVDNYSKFQSIFNFSGYILINSEIIQIDAMEYQYVDKNDATNTLIKVWIESQSDINKYRYLSKPGYQNPTKPETAYFKPTGRYRVKKRAALGTTASAHSATSSYTGWQGLEVVWS